MTALEAVVQNIEVIAQRYALKIRYEHDGDYDSGAAMGRDIDAARTELQKSLRAAIMTLGSLF